MNQFILNRQYFEMFEKAGINGREALKRAGLTEALFVKKNPAITVDEYFELVDAVASLVPDEDAIIKMGAMKSMESFSPPVFAAFCSKNAMVCIERLAMYKRLIGPVKFDYWIQDSYFYLEISVQGERLELPEFLVELEFVILMNLIRSATKEVIIPLEMITKHAVCNEALRKYMGTKLYKGTRNIIVLSLPDMEKPFISRNDLMWEYLEPELNKKIGELTPNSSFSSMISKTLFELLPGGESGIESVAKRMGVSKRTLQRKLAEEDTTFQKELIAVRLKLSIYYMRDMKLSNTDIAYLLGYQDLNSFLRAFHSWTGMNTREYRSTLSYEYNL